MTKTTTEALLTLFQNGINDEELIELLRAVEEDISYFYIDEYDSDIGNYVAKYTYFIPRGNLSGMDAIYEFPELNPKNMIEFEKYPAYPNSWWIDNLYIHGADEPIVCGKHLRASNPPEIPEQE